MNNIELKTTQSCIKMFLPCYSHTQAVGQAQPEKDTVAHLLVAKEADKIKMHALEQQLFGGDFIQCFNTEKVWLLFNLFTIESISRRPVRHENFINYLYRTQISPGETGYVLILPTLGSIYLNNYCTSMYSIVYLLRDLLNPGHWKLLYLSFLLSWACGLNKHPLCRYKT